MRLPPLPLLVALFACGATPALADGFRFSDPDTSAADEARARDARIAQDLAVPCRADLLNRKIMVVIGERL